MTPPSRWAPAAVRWLLYLPALAVLTLYAWGFLDHAWSVVTFPYQVDYGEMPELNRAWLLSRGQQIYVDWSDPPYQMANYTPLYSTAAAAGVRLAGVQFFTGRLLSLISTLAGSGFLAIAAWAMGGGVLGGILAALLYLAGHPVWNWGALQRVDAFAVAWELGGVALFAAGWVRRRRAAAVWWTVPLFLAAAFSRQTVAAGAVACYGYLLFRRPRLALAAGGVYAGAGLLAFGALQLATGGQLWRHVVDGNLNRWSWDIVAEFWWPFWRLLHWSFPLAAVALLLLALRRRCQLPLLYLAASAATVLTIGKIGSNVNYLIQLWAALSLCTGLCAGQVAALLRPRRAPWLAGAAIALLNGLPAGWLLVGLQQAYHVPYVDDGGQLTLRGPAGLLARAGWTRRRLWRLDPLAGPPGELNDYFRQRYLPNPSEGQRAAAGLAQAYVGRLDEDVLGEEMSFTVTTGKRIYLQPFEFTQLAEQGRWDQRPLLEQIRQGRFNAVVLRFDLKTDPSWRRERVGQPMIDALAEAYALDARYGDYFIYRPRR